MNKNSSKSKTATSKTKKNPAVSKYFKSNKHTIQSKEDESGQKSTSNKSDPKNQFNDSADDFRSPMPIPKRRNLTWKLKAPSQKTNKKSKSKAKNCTLAIIKDNFEGGDENPEHLQMAIALSKSTYEAEYGHNSELQNNVPDSVPDIGEILQNVKSTNLERFGFKKSKPTMSAECRTLQKPVVSRKGKGRSKYITQILDIRSPQERESIINSKITFILSQPNIATKQKSQISLTSLKLQEFKSENCTLFGLENLYQKNCFYVEDLLLEKSQHKCCGFLLKDWTLIPGRDKSPTKIPSNDTETSCKSPSKINLGKESLLKQKSLQQFHLGDGADDSSRSPLIKFCESSINTDTKKLGALEAKDSGISILGQYYSSSLSTNRSISPDLFSSDEEYDCHASNKNEATISQIEKNNEYDDIPMNQSNSSWRPPDFYSLNDIEDHEGELGSGYEEENSDEECISSPKRITENKEIGTRSSIEYSTCSKKETSSRENITDLISECMVPISSEFDSPKPTASICENEITHDLFQSDATINKESIPENLPKFINEGLSSIHRNEDVLLSTFMNDFGKNKESCCSSLGLVSFPRSFSSTHESTIESVDTADMESTAESFKSEHLVDSDKYLVESEFKVKISNDMEIDCPLSNHSHDDMVPHLPSKNSSSQQNQSCIEILDDSSSDIVYESKPSKSPIFDDYKFDPTGFHETPKKSPTNKSTPPTTRFSSLRTSNAYSSAELNVTDYVNQILNKERFSFDNHHIEINEEMSTSQNSQNDFVDEELNYSCHFATPVRPFREVDITPKSFHKEAPVSIIEAISTPNKYIIKTENITPMPHYDKMATPLINKELEKLGIKPLKRAKGSKLLKYIYESTHPLEGSVDLIEASDLEGEGKIIKRRKTKQEQLGVETETVLNDPCNNFSIEIVGDLLLQNEKPENLIFERKQSAKIPSCRVPLQTVWHNLLSGNPTIKENILLYEPLHLEFLHELLKEQGFKFHAQDLLTFLDKKCITIRTNQNRGKKHR